jgi:hypothetical protein
MWAKQVTLGSGTPFLFLTTIAAHTAARTYRKWNIPLGTATNLALKWTLVVAIAWPALPWLASICERAAARPAGFIAFAAVPPWLPLRDSRARAFREGALRVITFLLCVPSWGLAQALFTPLFYWTMPNSERRVIWAPIFIYPIFIGAFVVLPLLISYAAQGNGARAGWLAGLIPTGIYVLLTIWLALL